MHDAHMVRAMAAEQAQTINRAGDWLVKGGLDPQAWGDRGQVDRMAGVLHSLLHWRNVGDALRYARAGRAAAATAAAAV